jgi:hypothetical protein
MPPCSTRRKRQPMRTAPCGALVATDTSDRCDHRVDGDAPRGWRPEPVSCLTQHRAAALVVPPMEPHCLQTIPQRLVGTVIIEERLESLRGWEVFGGERPLATVGTPQHAVGFSATVLPRAHACHDSAGPPRPTARPIPQLISTYAEQDIAEGIAANSSLAEVITTTPIRSPSCVRRSFGLLDYGSRVATRARGCICATCQ